MKKTAFIFLCFCSFFVQSQSYIGYLTDNYSGVHGVISNPANIVDSRFRTDINLIGYSLSVSNDYYQISFSNLLRAAREEVELKDVAKATPLKSNNVNVNLDVLGPSFMFNLAPKHSVAITTRVRGLVDIRNISGQVLGLIETDMSKNDAYKFTERNFVGAANLWGELGLSYATVLLNKQKHFLKGGFTVKYLKSVDNAYGYAENVDIDYKPEGAEIIVPVQGGGTIVEKVPTFSAKGSVSYGYVDKGDTQNRLDAILKGEGDVGVGADFGFIYEWRPNYEDYLYTDDEGKVRSYKNKNKYKLKLGVSITDLGGVENEAIETTYSLDKTITQKDYKTLDEIQDVLNSLSQDAIKPTEKKAEKFTLPTMLHINADWNLYRKFYVNFNSDIAVSGSGKNEGRMVNAYTLTPRYESKWFGFYVPVGVYEYAGFQMGAGLKLGGLYVGSGSIISALSNDLKGADIYFGLKIPIYQPKPKRKVAAFDDDNNIPNEETETIEEDTDGDGVLDKDDKCPNVIGTAENEGCPQSKIMTKEAKTQLDGFARAIYFNTGKTSFKTGVSESLNAIVSIMKEYKNAEFSIEGHTDDLGSNSSNLKLSEERAKAVLDYLVEKGIAQSRLKAVGFGEEQPIASNETEEGRAENRRVEIKLKK